jgi:hypothetical protein
VTSPDGHAVDSHVDTDGNERVQTVTTLEGQAIAQHRDRNGKIRIAASTLPTGKAAVEYYDGEQTSPQGLRASPVSRRTLPSKTASGLVRWAASKA